MSSKAPLIIMSGPSGVGKSTIIHRLLDAKDLPLRLSISATTRNQRPGEVDGYHYHFWDRPKFENALEEDHFLEHAEVHGNLYGTPRSEVDHYREQGVGVILDIDVQGFDQVRAKCDDFVAIFLEAANYEQRLRDRGTENESAIQRRLQTAQRELLRAPEYQHRIINDDLETTVAKVRHLIESQFSRR